MKRFLSFLLFILFTISLGGVHAKAVKKTVKAKKKTVTEKLHKEKSDSTDTKKKSKKETVSKTKEVSGKNKKPIAKVNPDEPVTKPTLRDGSPDMRYKANVDAAKMHVQKDDE